MSKASWNARSELSIRATKTKNKKQKGNIAPALKEII